MGLDRYFDKNIKKNLDVITGDVCDTSLMLKKQKFDVVFHLAALISIPYSYKSPLSYINTNILGSISALEAARINSCELFVVLQQVRSMDPHNMFQLTRNIH